MEVVRLEVAPQVEATPARAEVVRRRVAVSRVRGATRLEATAQVALRAVKTTNRVQETPEPLAGPVSRFARMACRPASMGRLLLQA